MLADALAPLRPGSRWLAALAVSSQQVVRV